MPAGLSCVCICTIYACSWTCVAYPIKCCAVRLCKGSRERLCCIYTRALFTFWVICCLLYACGVYITCVCFCLVYPCMHSELAASCKRMHVRIRYIHRVCVHEASFVCLFVYLFVFLFACVAEGLTLLPILYSLSCEAAAAAGPSEPSSLPLSRRSSSSMHLRIHPRVCCCFCCCCCCCCCCCLTTKWRDPSCL